MAEVLKFHLSLWQRIKRALIDDAPPASALCEFDCPHVDCSEAKWQGCENRLRDVALSEGVEPELLTPGAATEGSSGE